MWINRTFVGEWTKVGFVTLVIFLIAGVVLPAFFPLDTMAEESEKQGEPLLEARAALLIDRQSGRILYAKNENEMLPIASTTKIMTALLAIELCDPSEIVTASANASGTSGTSLYLGAGEELTMDQMLKGLLLRSANDAAVAIAEHIDGSTAQFAERMNERAKSLWADAHFLNPHGLDEKDHGASALGLAKIACEALKNESFRQYVTTQSATLPWRDSQYDRLLTNKNKLLKTYDGATGIKTGFTSKAGRCLVFSAEREGMELVGVLLNCGAWFDEAKELLDWAFDKYSLERIASAGVAITEIPVLSGEYQMVEAVLKDPALIPLAQDEEAVLFLDIPEQIVAPIEINTPVGIAWVEINGRKVWERELYARQTVGEWGYLPAIIKVARAWALQSVA